MQLPIESHNWINGIKDSQLPNEDLKFYPLQGKRTLFYGFNKGYVLLFLVPIALGLVAKLMRAGTSGSINAAAIVFAISFTALFVAIIFAINYNKLKYLKEVQKRHKGKEIATTPQAIYISAGELIRSETNGLNFGHGFQKKVTQLGVEYLEIPFAHLRGLKMKGHTLTLFSKDPNKSDIEITIGDYSQDRAVLDPFQKDLEKYFNSPNKNIDTISRGQSDEKTINLDKPKRNKIIYAAVALFVIADVFLIYFTMRSGNSSTNLRSSEYINSCMKDLESFSKKLPEFNLEGEQAQRAFNIACGCLEDRLKADPKGTKILAEAVKGISYLQDTENVPEEDKNLFIAAMNECSKTIGQ